MRYFPPVVTGTVITVIGVSLMGVGINWAAGGNPSSANWSMACSSRFPIPITVRR